MDGRAQRVALVGCDSSTGRALPRAACKVTISRIGALKCLDGLDGRIRTDILVGDAEVVKMTSMMDGSSGEGRRAPSLRDNFVHTTGDEAFGFRSRKL